MGKSIDRAASVLLALLYSAIQRLLRSPVPALGDQQAVPVRSRRCRSSLTAAVGADLTATSR